MLKSYPALAKTAGLVGGVYLAHKYVRDRLDDLKSKLDTENVARQVLKKRFQSTQEDVSYTVLALLPTLADQIMHGMDVESLTHQLQNISKPRPQQQQQQPRQPSARSTSLPSSVVNLNLADGTSEAGSTASTADALSGLSSWVVESAASEAHQNLSESVITAETSSSAGGGNDTRLSDSVISVASDSSTSSSSRTKAELWAEVKILTFTRTLTTLYSITLLCLLTTVQLTILARSKYVASVLEHEREERVRDQLEEYESQMSLPNILLETSTKMVRDVMAGYVPQLPELNKFGLDVAVVGAVVDVEKGGEGVEGVVTEEVERKFLTLSWWILHVGWKDIGERVRRGVEEVFEGVSLKSKLAAIDLHRLVRDVRRRVEHEITFEGRERRVNFLSTLLPPTPEMIQHVLTQGGFLSDSGPSLPPPLPPPPPSLRIYGSASQEGHETQTQETQETQETHETPETQETLSFSELSHEFDASPATGLSGLFNHPGNPHNVVSLGDPNLGVRVHQRHHPPPPPPHQQQQQPPQPQQAGGRGQERELERERERERERDTDVGVDCYASVSHLEPTPQWRGGRRPRPTLRHVHDPPFCALVEETRAMVCSRDFEHVLEACLECATGVMVEGLERGVFGGGGESGGGGGGGQGEEGRIRLASLLPGLARWSREALRGLPNEVVENVLVMREVSCLSAIGFAKFEERFPV
ncbi:hypothetical protein APHAL10511_001440 [Amanita phalloides]|nr:hypothetical protein APHAL10511_001440 [Amanita phalloides]